MCNLIPHFVEHWVL